VLLGWQYATLVSPIFVTILLTKVSGINLLEASSDQKWGSLESYQEYKEKTSVLIPFIK
jgi:steroid 5-alpha reductase family enzyme